MKWDRVNLNRRDLLKIAGVGAVSAALPGCSDNTASVAKKPVGITGIDGRRVLPWSNWSGNQSCQPNQRLVPRNESQLIEAVKNSQQPIRCVGSSHSFSNIVATDNTLMSLARFRGVKNIDKATRQVDIAAGTRLADIGEPLWEAGLGLINMPDIDTQSLAGAIATSTHGTGKTLGSMSSTVQQITMINGQGDKVICSAEQNSDVFNAARNNIGMLGVATEFRLQAKQRYHLKERSWMLPLGEGLAQIEQQRDQHRHFEAYALPHADYILFISLDEVDQETFAKAPAVENNGDAYETFRTLAKVIDYAPFMRSFIMNRGAATVDPEERYGRSHDIFGNLRDIRFNEMEYSIPAEHGVECLSEILATIKKHDVDVIFPLEYRYVKADDVWLSPFYQRDSCSISCHNFHDRDYKKYFALLEPIFKKYQGRPHWGKIHTLEQSQLSALYPRWDDFMKVRQQMDPQNKFVSNNLKELFSIG
ncbi:D-arabinono-1,4-lactone oxidase [Pelagibaculum spongiae]|uniref:FAD-linked oxidoreductase n=1 Tax=Pelagibaculum spongiae TaxID=2080658 RepID=A0A2V1GUY2_9GAMM|nr:D-arabinono-1,4-lactone oxidase [Pelagibaculum spongiae]PVZ66708.1 FAD-linked oxidoreductase [Pelagibaculum spongiae]